ncbi:MAG TPA: alpha-L-rhamnosidase C-terminal domain-containing protein, partial [Cyclobacteriaceae bacterium]
PQFVTGLEQFSAEHNGPQGLIKSTWKRNKKGISYSVTVPANSTATFYLPEVKNKKVYRDKKVINETMVALEAGTHTFEWR